MYCFPYKICQISNYSTKTETWERKYLKSFHKSFAKTSFFDNLVSCLMLQQSISEALQQEAIKRKFYEFFLSIEIRCFSAVIDGNHSA